MSTAEKKPVLSLKEAVRRYVPDGQELLLGTNALRADSDDDGMPDGWEVTRLLDPLAPGDAQADADGD
ncbi:MAG: hypothetical protein ACXW2I_15830, partial [Burkholderiales bacterium]